MKIEVDFHSLKLPSVNTDDMLRRISTGKAIIFTGAGFSKKTINILNEEPPLAKELSKKIGVLGGIGDDIDDLMFTSRFFLKYKDKSDLLSLLKDSFILKKVTKDHEFICSLPWRRFYTTNYDNSIELACLSSGKRVDALDIDAKPSNYMSQENLCIHLNGVIDKAIPDDLESKIKLTNSSYLTAQSFVNSQWNYVFKRDLETSSAIIFVGYSMYDMDVQRLLYQTDNLIDKTYFIVSEDADFKSTFFLTEFGHVLPIGLSGFSELTKSINPDGEKSNAPYLECFSLREIKHTDKSVTDSEIKDFLLFGKFSEHQIDTSISNEYHDFLLIHRDLITDSIRLIDGGENILIHSELGNGKTIFLQQLTYSLTQRGHKVYIYSGKSEYDDELSEIDIIASKKEQPIIIIEGYNRAQRLLKHISIKYPTELRVIIVDRSAVAARSAQLINSLGLDFSEISLDQLTDSEIHNFINLLENQGLWEELTTLSKDAKLRKIKDDYNGQMSGILLGLLNSPSIKNKIKALTDELFNNQEYKDTIFGIALCDVIDVNKTSSMISEISESQSIYKMDLRNNDAFKSLYRFVENGNAIETKSSLMSLAIINNCFQDSYIKHKLLSIVENFNRMRNVSHDSNNVFKSLLRFHILEILMPQKQKALDSYYMELKRVCPWLKESPHYWVQYAMCRLSIGDLDSAQTYLNDAYSLARSRTGYHTENIDTQQARLLIMKCLKENDPSKSFTCFQDAHNILIGLPDDGYKHRQILPYKDVFDGKYKYFNKGNKVSFEHACKALLQQVESAVLFVDDLTLIKRVTFINKSKTVLEDILDKIKNLRS
ncbi:SIR2 family protein [Pectobacterium brasiliense]|uniref:SIR2 family protein n=1 Tax=Pectobacterium brasiliense TaxID=180957 RepID=UPI0015DD53D4|nr:SIR2 family protein [Pectobacterium brasiliense]MBA0218435.1 SIR2 family protein [Pectobacterium brasiliense]MBN3070648.1 SIR2 family protein [Pectobacterium brasiliense]MBN3169553.1 SIR2 family protein [Pectobacterium brasiliense]WJM81320.1 SIR2 family protein [Pectobacterium brasiliense]